MCTPSDTDNMLRLRERLPRRVSVVVPVYNRWGRLCNLLESLGRQTMPSDWFEVIVCDDGSEGTLPSGMFEDAVMRYGYRIVYLRQNRGGPGRARNLGIAHAVGTIIAFTDSDCEADSGWLMALWEGFHDPAVKLAGGPVIPSRDATLWARCANFLLATSLGGGGTTDPRALIHVPYFPGGCNLAVRCETAAATSGYPPYWYGEDVEFSCRVCEQGIRPKFLGKAIVAHNETRGLGAILVQNVRKGAARIRLARRCGMHSALHALPALLVLGFAIVLILTPLLPRAAVVMALLYGLYGVALMVLAVQSCLALSDPRTLIATPVCALAMHVGFGLGYLAAGLRHFIATGNSPATDWSQLRASAVASVVYEAEAGVSQRT